MSNCGGTLDSRGWCQRCGGGHESDREMATRLDLTRKQHRLLDRIQKREGHGGSNRA